MIRFLITCLLLLGILSTIGCALRPSGDVVMDFEYMVNDLRLSGVIINETGDAFLLGLGREPVFSGKGKYIRLSGEKAPINVWEYRDEEAALTEVEFISRDGFDIRRPPGPDDEGFAGHYDWIAPPHWYQSGKIIVLYVGETLELRILLNELLGEQFAGQGRVRNIK